MSMTSRRLDELLTQYRGNRSGFINKLKSEDNTATDTSAGQFFDNRYPPTQNTNSTQQQGNRLLTPTSIAKAMSFGVSSNSEMGTQHKVDMEGLLNPLTAYNTLQNDTQLYKLYTSLHNCTTLVK